MKFVATLVAIACLGVSGAYADSCASMAIDKNGKALAGAAKTSSIHKCMKDIEVACEVKAIDKNGKPLAGAAKTSSITKCVKEAGA